MDFKKIKEYADDKYNLQKEVIQLLVKLDELSKNISTKWNELIKQKSIEFRSSFEKYFSENGFDIKPQGDDLIAEYKGVHLSLEGFNECGEKMLLRLPNDENNITFIISSPSGSRYTYGYQGNIMVEKISHKNFFIEKVGYNNENFINAFQTMEQLVKVKNEIIKEITLINEEFQNIESTKFITIFSAEEQYWGFEDFIESVQLELK